MTRQRRVVVKVGGSLFDLPDLGERLAAWLQSLRPAQVLLVTGGGAMADAIRELDRRFRLGDAVAHDLAIQAMNLNAVILSTLVGRVLCQHVPILKGPSKTHRADELICLDAHAFCTSDARESLPASWNVSSDSIAAQAAIVFDADELVLLKSETLSEPYDWTAAAEGGHVDAHFPQLVSRVSHVRAVNLRRVKPADEKASGCP